MGGVWSYRSRGIPACCRGRPQSGNTGNYSAMGMRSRGRTSMSILGSKVCWRGDAVGKVPTPLLAGWPRAVLLLNKSERHGPSRKSRLAPRRERRMTYARSGDRSQWLYRLGPGAVVDRWWTHGNASGAVDTPAWTGRDPVGPGGAQYCDTGSGRTGRGRPPGRRKPGGTLDGREKSQDSRQPG